MGKIEKISTVGMSREDWLAHRKKRIGGSDASAVVGMNPYSSPYALWAEKTGRVPGFAGNLATEVGTFLEEFVAKKFEAETGKKVRKCNNIIINTDYEFAHANVDRLISGEDAGLEVKTTSELNLKKFRGREFPDIYYAQCVHYLAVTGKQRWYLAVLIGNKEFKWFALERDEAEIAALMTAEAEFWKLVEMDIPPAVDGTAATTGAIGAIYANSNDGVADLTAHNADIARYLELGNQIKELEAQRDEAANRVKEFLGECGSGECEGFRVSWKSQSRRTFDSKKFEKENPDIDLSDYFKQSVSRPFKVTEVNRR